MAQRRDHSKRLLSFAKEMRSAPTDAEKKLWSILRAGRLNGYWFRRQVPIAGYILDFVCLAEGLGVEADGGQHYEEQGKLYDQRRSAALLQQRIRVLRFSDIDILKDPDAVRRMIYRELTEPGCLTKPSP